MEVKQHLMQGVTFPGPEPDHQADLVLVFGGTAQFEHPDLWRMLREAYPLAHLFGCTTAGEIFGTEVVDDCLAITVTKFAHTQLRLASMDLGEEGDSRYLGVQLAQRLAGPDLDHVLLLSDGLNVNATELAAGMQGVLGDHTAITGGLAADAARFDHTLVLADAPPRTRRIAALGFYGNRLRVGYGSVGGWDAFGPERLVTRSSGNILYELDGMSALDLYKSYLGRHASDLPAAGLLFPLRIKTSPDAPGLVRTILAVNETEQSMIFAGDIPQGACAQLMKVNFDRLVEGAITAARVSDAQRMGDGAQLALLISCVGRKLVLKQRVEEEVEGVREILGKQAVLAGFYSYGEISPHVKGGACELHNQTMTITTFAED